jgi:hypothetical protein
LRLFIHEETETAEGGRVSRSHLFIFSLFFSLTCSFDGSKSVRSFVIMSLNRFVYLKPPRLPTFFPDENCWFVPSELFVRASARAIFALGDSSSDSGPTRSPEWDRFHLQVMKKRLWFSTFAMSVPSLSWQKWWRFLFINDGQRQNKASVLVLAAAPPAAPAARTCPRYRECRRRTGSSSSC